MAEITDSAEELLNEIEVLEALPQGVSKTSVIWNDSLTIVQGTKERPLLVQVKAEEDGGFITAGVNSADFLPGTTPEQISNLNWIFGTKRPGKLFTSDDSYGNYPAIQVSVKRQYCGSAIGWIEGFIEEPKNTSPQGFFIQGVCEAKIKKIEWRNYSANNDGAITSGAKHFGDTVQLHVITEGLNGDKLHVDFYTEDDHWLGSSFGDTYDGILILNVPISSAWKSKFFSLFRAGWGSKAIKITIKYEKLVGVSPFYDGVTIENELISDGPSKTGIVPVSVGSTEVQTTDYLPCKYTEINLSTTYKDRNDADQDRKYVFFKENGIGRTSRDYFEVTAGEDVVKKVDISLASTLSTMPDAQCVETPNHENNVFSINGEAITAAPSPAPPATAPGTQPSTPPAPAEESRWEGSFKVNGSASHGNQSVSGTYNSNTSKPASAELKGDTLNLGVVYPYNFPTSTADIAAFFRLFWPASARTIDYPININTCRHKKTAIIRTYPDIKWAVSIDFNNANREKTIYNRTYTVTKNSKVVPKEDQSWQKIGDFTIGLGCKITYNGNEEIKISREIKDKYEDKIQGVKKFTEMLKSLFMGESDTLGENHPDNNISREAEAKQHRIKRDLEKKDLSRILGSNRSGLNSYSSDRNGFSDINSADRRLAARHQGIKRDLMTFGVLWPDISIALSWGLEETLENQDHINKVGTLLEASITANPLVGLTMKLDFLALIQRAHPVALAIIAVADIALDLIGDGSSMELSLESTGKLSAEIGGFLNTLTGENTFNRDSLEGTDRKIAKASGDLEFKAKAAIYLQADRQLFFIGPVVVGKLNAHAQASAKFGADFALRADDQGFYVERTLRFDGLEVSGGAAARIEVKTRRSADASSVGGGVEGEFKYIAIKKSKTLLDPWRFD